MDLSPFINIVAKIQIRDVIVHKNTAPFFSPFKFEIKLNCLQEIQDDVMFKIIYICSQESVDQTLNQYVFNSLPRGQSKFFFQANPPDTSLIPAKDATGSAAVLITAAFRGQEFVNVGYFMSNRYDNKEMRLNPPTDPQFDRIVRRIEVDQPRITRFGINWDSNLEEFSGMHIN